MKLIVKMVGIIVVRVLKLLTSVNQDNKKIVLHGYGVR
jgi:hypothetical protein